VLVCPQFPRTAIREVKILKSLHHPHMVNLREVICSIPEPGGDDLGVVSLVFEYVDFDMTGLVQSGVRCAAACGWDVRLRCVLR